MKETTHNPKTCKKKKCFLCAYPKAERIKTITDLKQVLKDHRPHEFWMMLAGSAARSVKTITWVGTLKEYGMKYISSRSHFLIKNHIDDSQQTLNTKTILDESYTNIGVSMKAGGFWFIE